MTNKEFIVVLDFDGTVVKHRYPDVGDEIGATPVLKRLVSNGHKIILNTMRSRNNEGMDMLQPAVDWFSERGIPLFGVNENPTQHEWTSSPKVYGHIYIDDAALGAPLVTDVDDKYIDWKMAAAYLYYAGLLSENDITELFGDI